MSEASSAMLAREADFTRLLVEPLARGGCVLLLGPGVAVDPDDPAGEPLTTRLARQLAAAPELGIAEGDRNRDNLRYVAEVYARTIGRDELELAVQDFYSPFSDKTTPLHRELATLPFALCIDTLPDGFMLNAFRSCPGKAARAAHYNFRPGTRVAVPAQPSAREPLVYNLYGCVEDPLSLVLSESDLLDFLVNVVRNEPELPGWMRAILSKKDTAFLFLGFGFQNWYVRVLLHALKMIESHRGYALEDRTFFEHPEYRQTVGFFGNVGKGSVIRFQEVSWTQFASRLRAAWERVAATASAAPRARAPAEAPQAFLSYARDDQDAADRLAAALEARGIRVWQDRQNLRTGDNWEQKIEHVIGKEVDYVIVLQSAAMARRGEGVFNAEIARALVREQRQGENLRFLLPVTIDDAAPLDRLRDLHMSDVRSEQGVNELVLAIQEDRRQRAAKSAA